MDSHLPPIVDLPECRGFTEAECAAARCSKVTRKALLKRYRWEITRGSWLFHRCWALARATGCWPLPVFGADDMPTHREECAACGERNVTAQHPVFHCPATLAYYEELARVVVVPPVRALSEPLLVVLFGGHRNVSAQMACIRYVGRSILWSLGECQPEALCDGLDVDELRFDGLARRTEEIWCQRADSELFSPEVDT